MELIVKEPFYLSEQKYKNSATKLSVRKSNA